MSKPLVIAHRGGAGLWPENTLFAFSQAIAAGYDGAELDVQLTRDGKLAVVHDFHLMADLYRDVLGTWLTRAGGRIRDTDYDYLREYDIGRPKRGSAYARAHPDILPKDGEYIPQLAEVIGLAKNAPKDFVLFIEIKTSLDDPKDSFPPEAVAEAAITALREARFAERAIFIGFDWKGLDHARRIAPEIPCWYSTGAGAPVDTARIIAEKGGQGWMTHFSAAIDLAVTESHKVGLQLGVWTVNAKSDMRTMRKRGVDVICTDYPDRLTSLLK